MELRRCQLRDALDFEHRLGSATHVPKKLNDFGALCNRLKDDQSMNANECNVDFVARQMLLKNVGLLPQKYLLRRTYPFNHISAPKHSY